MKVGRLSIFLIAGLVVSHTKSIAQEMPTAQSIEPTLPIILHKDAFIELTGYLGGVFLALCFLPQVIHTLKSKRADDVSMLMLLMSLFSASFYEVYAWFLGLKPVLLMNGLFLLLVVLELVLKIKFHYFESTTGSAELSNTGAMAPKKGAGPSD